MIFCCGGFHKPQKTVFLPSDFLFRDRSLEVLVCPVCGALCAQLKQFNIKEQKYETFRPKGKKAAKFIRKIQDGSWFEVKVKYGTREAAGFVYGVNREHKDGKIYQYAADFNGSKKLVKVIN